MPATFAALRCDLSTVCVVILFLQVDLDFSAGVSGFEVAQPVGRVVKRESPIDYRCDLSSLEETGQDRHVRFVELCNVSNELLANEPGPQIAVEFAKQTGRKIFMPS